MLGGLTPMGEIYTPFGQPQTFSTGANQSTITLPANQRQQNTSPVNVQPQSSVAPDGFAPPQPPPMDYMTMVKKYAPYVIGAVVLYYLILKNKK
jgi:hypothetical protein